MLWVCNVQQKLPTQTSRLLFLTEERLGKEEVYIFLYIIYYTYMKISLIFPLSAVDLPLNETEGWCVYCVCFTEDLTNSSGFALFCN